MDAPEEPEEEIDARVLVISRNTDGERAKDFREVVKQCTQTEWSHWPLTGPQTTRWVVRFLLEADGGPRARHTCWKRGAALKPADAGVLEHELAPRALQLAAEYDQLNVTELASMELLARRAQLSELKWKERVLRHDPQDEYGEDAWLYLGPSRRADR